MRTTAFPFPFTCGGSSRDSRRNLKNVKNFLASTLGRRPSADAAQCAVVAARVGLIGRRKSTKGAMKRME